MVDVAEQPRGVLEALRCTLGACSDQGLRVRAVACTTCVWESATAKWPEVFEAAVEDADGYSRESSVRRLAARLMNVALDTALYDPVGKARLAATKLLQQLVSALAVPEVLKLAILKARDKDAATRRVALSVCGRLGGEDGIAHLLTPAQVQCIVLHGSAADASDDQRACASRTFWDYIAAHHADPAGALAALRVREQLELYEPILRTHAEALFTATFPQEELE